MVKKFRHVVIYEIDYSDIEICEQIYRKHHPELKDIFLPKAYIMHEVIDFYKRTP